MGVTEFVKSLEEGIKACQEIVIRDEIQKVIIIAGRVIKKLRLEPIGVSRSKDYSQEGYEEVAIIAERGIKKLRL